MVEHTNVLIKQNVPLSELTTIKIGGSASVVITATTVNELIGALQQVKASGLPYRVLGWGSNVIGHDEGFSGVIILNKIGGFDVIKEIEQGARIKAGAGETLDTVVARTVEMGLTGIEALSSIPGTIGAAPVQNAGAYGQEIGDHLETLEAIDTVSMQPVLLTKAQCEFAYRDSVFKHNDRHYIITSVTMVLERGNPQPPFYASLGKYLEEHGITHYTPQVIRDAVIQIRKEKLPSPVLHPNAGSFFKNPIVAEQIVNDLTAQFPDMPSYPAGENQRKVPAGWLIEHAGLPGYQEGALHLHPGNALVVVNGGTSNYQELSHFREHLIATVREVFGITLEQEPEELQ